MFVRLYKIGMVLCLLTAFGGTAGAKKHGLSMHGDLKYQEGEPFHHVNPQAPKGGKIRFGVVGTFDTTNPFVTKGTPPAGLSLYSERLVFEGLMKRSPGEPFSLYGWLAQYVDVAPDRSAVTFYLNPRAKWSDGRPVLAEDVKFSFETFRDKGRPNMRLYYGRVASCDLLDNRTIRFTFKKEAEGYDPEQPLLMALMSVIPKHVYEGRDFEKVSLEAVVASGPYRIHSLKPGHSIVYELREDYWGKDLPLHQGTHNFKTVSFDFYRDSKVAYEAFKAGEYDIYRRTSASGWEDEGSFPALDKGLVKEVEWSHKMPVGFQGLAINGRRPLFQDPRVREALALAFDFETLNKTLFRERYTRSASYFPNTSLASSGLPKGGELALLLPFKDVLPENVFSQEFRLPQTVGHGGVRDNLRKAKALLEAVGFVRKGKGLQSPEGLLFEFEILLYNAEHLKVVSSFVTNLKKLGIIARPRVVDTAHYENRRLTYDYDMIVQTWGHTLSPGNEQKVYWGSQVGKDPGSRNYAGIAHPAVDALCQAVAQAKDRNALETAIHALDRVLLWGHYVIPLFHTNKIRLAYWDKFGYPEIDPQVGVHFATWWSKEQK